MPAPVDNSHLVDQACRVEVQSPGPYGNGGEAVGLIVARGELGGKVEGPEPLGVSPGARRQ